MIDLLRRARLEALMARHLVNWREVWRAYRHGAPAGPLRFRNGLVLHHGPRDSAGFLFFEVFANGCYRRGVGRAIRGSIVDIGANIGAFTLDCAWRHPEAVIHAYEPDPETCAVLRRNVVANRLEPRVQVWNEAVAGSAGTLHLWRGEGSMATSTFRPGETGGTPLVVPAVALDTVLRRAGGAIALLKIDAEGAEAEILETAGPALDRVDCIVAEYHRALVPEVIPRLRRVLQPSFDVSVAEGQRCGPMIRAWRRRLSRERS